MSEDRKDTLTVAPPPVHLGLYNPTGTPYVTADHALAPGARPLPSLMIQQPRDSLFPQGDRQQYLSQGPVGPISMGQSIDPALVDLPGTGAHEAYLANLQRAADVGLWGGQFGTFHGTGAPPFSRFMDEFIGTGEGAQAYSWGHYVAQKPGVAKTYIPEGDQGKLTLDGKPWAFDPDKGEYHPENIVNDYLLDHKGNINAATAALQRDVHYGPTGSPWARDALSWLDQNSDRVGYEKTGGSLLNVWVKPEHEEFLDWDLSHHEQEPGVQDKLRLLGDKMGMSEWWPSGRTGRQIYDDIAKDNLTKALDIPGEGNIYDKAKMLASKQLDENGIPGMRFLDQQSRHLPEDHPNRTYNYVIYNPENLEITHRNGQRLIPVDHNPFESVGGM